MDKILDIDNKSQFNKQIWLILSATITRAAYTRTKTIKLVFGETSLDIAFSLLHNKSSDVRHFYARGVIPQIGEYFTNIYYSLKGV